MLRPEEVRRPWTVSELALEIRRELRPLSTVLVKGEVSGMKKSARGHYGFTVRDQGAAIEAFLFADDARRLGLGRPSQEHQGTAENRQGEGCGEDEEEPTGHGRMKFRNTRSRDRRGDITPIGSIRRKHVRNKRQA